MARATPPRTLAMRVLDAARIPFQTLLYDDQIDVATDVAAAVGLPVGQVYKTLVVLRDGGRPLLVMIASQRQIDPRVLARALGEKRVHMAPQREAERLTGLKVGGISALALLNKPFDICLDRAALALPAIALSGGQRGVNLLADTAHLCALLKPRMVDACVALDGSEENEK